MKVRWGGGLTLEKILFGILLLLGATTAFVQAQPAGAPTGGDFAAPPGIGGGESVSGEGATPPRGMSGPGEVEGGGPPGGAGLVGMEAGGEGGSTNQAPPSVMDIDEVEGEENLYTLELRDADLGDLFRVLAHKYKLNILVDKDVSGTVTASLTNISLEEAMDRIAEMHGLIIERKGNILIVKPDLITRVFVLKHIEAASLLQEGGGQADQSQGSGAQDSGTATLSGAVAGGGPDSGTPSAGGTTGATTSGRDSATGGGSSAASAGSIYDFLSERGKVFLGRKPNSIMVIDHPDNIAKIEEFLNMVDRGMVSRVFHLKYISPADILHNVQSPDSTGGSQDQGGDGGTTPPPSQ